MIEIVFPKPNRIGNMLRTISGVHATGMGGMVVRSPPVE